MGKPDLRHRPGLERGEIQADSSGYLHATAMRRAVVEMGGIGAKVEVLEALGALRLAAKHIHDPLERVAERQAHSEIRLRVLTHLHHSSSPHMPPRTLAAV